MFFKGIEVFNCTICGDIIGCHHNHVLPERDKIEHEEEQYLNGFSRDDENDGEHEQNMVFDLFFMHYFLMLCNLQSFIHSYFDYLFLLRMLPIFKAIWLFECRICQRGT